MITMPFDIAMDENPLDAIEEHVQMNLDWHVTRINEHVMFVEVEAQSCRKYMVYLKWDEQTASISMETVINIHMHPQILTQAHEILAEVNANTWIGHFTLSEEKNQPVYRYTILTQFVPPHFMADYACDTVNGIMAECEKFNTTFEMLANEDTSIRDVLNVTLMKTAGQA